MATPNTFVSYDTVKIQPPSQLGLHLAVSKEAPAGGGKIINLSNWEEKWAGPDCLQNCVKLQKIGKRDLSYSEEEEETARKMKETQTGSHVPTRELERMILSNVDVVCRRLFAVACKIIQFQFYRSC